MIRERLDAFFNIKISKEAKKSSYSFYSNWELNYADDLEQSFKALY